VERKGWKVWKFQNWALNWLWEGGISRQSRREAKGPISFPEKGRKAISDCCFWVPDSLNTKKRINLWFLWARRRLGKEGRTVSFKPQEIGIDRIPIGRLPWKNLAFQVKQEICPRRNSIGLGDCHLFQNLKGEIGSMPL